MGCGALCGDVSTAESIVNQQSKQAFQNLVEKLCENKQLIRTQTYSSFLQDYQQKPQNFQLICKKQLLKDEQITQAVRTKWKLVILGLDKDDKSYCSCIGLENNEVQNNQKDDQGIQVNQKSALIYHSQFVQIEKDLERTFSVFNIKVNETEKKKFENILKRITNHFPKMGYSQGINFFISYLLVIGYSEQDSFDIFVHLAINKRFLLLGLYEHGFPLSMALQQLFSNILKRINSRLYSHIFEQLCFFNELWIFKWLTAFYISKFPKELIKYIWEIVIVNGCFGMVMIAIGLLLQLEPYILEITDYADLNALFESLIHVQNFNRYVNLHQFMSKVHRVELILSDFDNIETNSGFYGAYMKCRFQIQIWNKNNSLNDDKYASISEKAQNLLRNWHSQLINDRIIFKNDVKIQDSPQIQIQISTEKAIEKCQPENQDFQVVILHIDEPIAMASTSQTSITRNNSQSTKSEVKINPFKKVEYLCNKINQNIDQQERSASSISKSKSKLQNQPCVSIEIDQLDLFQRQFNEINNRQQNNNLIRKNLNYIQKERSARTRPTNNEKNPLSLAGQISMRNDYDAVSVSSRKTSKNSNINNNYHDIKLSIPRINRGCGCKTKTEENKLESQKSQISQSKDQLSDRDFQSIKNYSQNQYNLNDVSSIKNSETHRAASQLDYIISSHGPIIQAKINNFSQAMQTSRAQNEVQFINSTFKKNKRARINIISPVEFTRRQSIEKAESIGWQHEQESIESIYHIDQNTQINNHHYSSGNTYEIESIR